MQDHEKFIQKLYDMGKWKKFIPIREFWAGNIDKSFHGNFDLVWLSRETGNVVCAFEFDNTENPKNINKLLELQKKIGCSIYYFKIVNGRLKPKIVLDENVEFFLKELDRWL